MAVHCYNIAKNQILQMQNQHVSAIKDIESLIIFKLKTEPVKL